MGRFIPDYTIESFAGGTNTRDAPLGLGPADLIGSANMYPIAGGPLVGRGGQTELFPNQIDANQIRTLYRFYKANGTRLTLATSGTKVYTVSASGETEIDSGYTADKKFSMVTWSAKDKVYWTNGVEALKSYDGTTVAAVGGSPPIGSMIEFHDDRLWALQENLVRFSGLNVDNTWAAADALNIADSQGGTGKFIKSFGRGLLVVGKDTGLYRFEGSPKLGGKLTRFSDVKCIAAWSADVSPFGIPFLAPDGIWATDGFDVNRISGKIDPLFTTFFRGAVGKYYHKKRQYFLSLDTAGAANDELWVATYVDTPEGPVISWNEFTGFKAESFSVWDGAGDVGEIYYGRSDGGKVRRLDTGTQDVGANYKCSFQTRWDPLGSLTRAKQARWLFPVFEATQQVNYQIAYSFGKSTVTGPAEQRSVAGVPWGPGTVTWGPGSVSWVGGGPVQAEPTSCLNFDWGRYLSFYFENTGDGSNFKFYNLGVETKVKEAHHRQPFAIAS